MLNLLSFICRMTVINLLVKLFSSSKEEISRFCTKLEIQPDQTYDDLRKGIKTVTESYYDLAEMQRVGKREEKLSVANSDERLVFAVVDDESWKVMLNGLIQKPTVHSMICKCYQPRNFYSVYFLKQNSCRS